MRKARFPANRGGILNRLRRAAIIAFCVHLAAGLGMAFILRHGLETAPDLQHRLAFLTSHRWLWTFAWLNWTAAAIAILYFYLAFAETHAASRFAVLLTVAALGPDFAAQAIEIGVLPSLAAGALTTNSGPELFLTLHRLAVVLSGYVANGLYSATAMILAFTARKAYPAWVSGAGIAVGIFGIALSVAAFLDSAAGMFWTNVLLMPALLLWLGAIAAFDH